MAFSHSPRIVTDGLVLCLDAANPQSYPGSGTTWTDLSGNGNNGTLFNSPAFSSGSSGSIVFDGSDDYVGFGNIPIANITSVNNFTINIWMLRSVSGLGIGILHKGPVSGNDYDWMVYLNGSTNNVQFYKKNTSNVGSAVTGFNSDLNTIVNISISLSSDVVYFYKNGSFISSSSLDGDIRTSSDPFKIGRGWDGSLNGKVYSNQIYNRALSASEVLQNFEAVKSRFGL